MYKKLSNGWKKHIDFFLLDLICIQVSFWSAYFIRYGWKTPWTDKVYADMFFILIFVHISILFVKDAYSGVLRRNKYEEAISTVKYNAVYFVLMLMLMFVMHEVNLYSRIVLCLFVILDTGLMFVVRCLWKRHVLNRPVSDKKLEYLLLVCEKAEAEKLIKQVSRYPYTGTRLCGVAVTDCDMTGEMIENALVVASKSTVMDYCLAHVVDSVLLSVPDKQKSRYMKQFINMGITVHLNMREVSKELPNVMIEKMYGSYVVTASIGTATPFELIVKRLMDIAGGLVGTVIMALLFVIFAPIIYIQSPGPIFFKQTRVGKNGRKFQIYKFRSMYTDAEERKQELMKYNQMSGNMFKMDNDPRVTPIGRFMRKTSIDEFPQFINILKGDMSLVGTRPPTVDEYEKYDRHHKSRLATKPGLTGLWQISGRSNVKDFEKVVEMDNQYIQNWNLMLDVKILFKTVKVVLKREGSK